ncbi:anthocyanin regulatory R-S protein-like [Hordeum vulgare subsp. vulgare]|uniref:anthocyanin regulatory R-S protein-like n=1 Tax=Hordeum vulgare subsp. vulgare TaxID=112509 RepID=UPI001D1A40E9|nr:anthocyanin regulatory R-S protein-like [Hordeum vulgare subsp. vulgare]
MALSAPPSQEQPSGKKFGYHLAAAVRSINWTYGIFWSISASPRPGHSSVLTWKDGFYNGEIKTRKITGSTTPEFTPDERVMHRSKQLRQLYESLLPGNSDQRARRCAASLSPEDLGDGEWYYTISMTYKFHLNQGLPGKSFASNQYVWLCNAQNASTRTFPRALLAKTASIQTIVCIPFMGGVLELGTLDQVLEDSSMVKRISTSFWELHLPASLESKDRSSSTQAKETREATDIILFEDFDHSDTVDGMISEQREVQCPSNVNLERLTTQMDEFHSLLGGLDVHPVEERWIIDEPCEFMSSPEVAPAMNMPSTTDVVVTSSRSEGSRPSCFTAWKGSCESKHVVGQVVGESQKLLNKVVTGGAWASNYGGGTMEDKASILTETIGYLRELKQRVDQPESSRSPSDPKELTGRSRSHVVGARKKIVSAGSKRKSPGLESPSNVVNVTVLDKVVLLEVKCPWKELLMTQVFDAIKSLYLDVVSVHASTSGGRLDLKIRANQQLAAGAAIVAPGVITEALQRAL